jgi:hypothetical protein
MRALSGGLRCSRRRLFRKQFGLEGEVLGFGQLVDAEEPIDCAIYEFCFGCGWQVGVVSCEAGGDIGAQSE